MTEQDDAISDRRRLLIEHLWRYYDENAAQARHHDDQREKAASLIVAISAAVAAVAASDGLQRVDAPAGALVIALGILGAVATLKHYERSRLHTKILGAARVAAESAIRGSSDVPAPGQIRAGAEQDHAASFRWWRKGSPRIANGHWPVNSFLNRYWLAIDSLIAAMGVWILIASLSD